jgi:hypothetical protein
VDKPTDQLRRFDTRHHPETRATCGRKSGVPNPPNKKGPGGEKAEVQLCAKERGHTAHSNRAVWIMASKGF